jgi:hypothetical protein
MIQRRTYSGDDGSQVVRSAPLGRVEYRAINPMGVLVGAFPALAPAMFALNWSRDLRRACAELDGTAADPIVAVELPRQQPRSAALVESLTLEVVRARGVAGIGEVVLETHVEESVARAALHRLARRGVVRVAGLVTRGARGGSGRPRRVYEIAEGAS